MTKSTKIHASLQRVLDASGQSMDDVATLLGISASTVSRWAKYGISKAGANKLGKLLGLDPDWILAGNTPDTKAQKQHKIIAKEAMLEFVEQENGVFVLKEMGGDDVWVSIDFADKLKEMLGKETLQAVGQHMIQAGIASFMERQMRQYHAHVYDETPQHFS
ncbi:MAG: helix-turn-helix domain-containing protein [Moraxella sp.]|nr:helix-turn-helix domain-containing protein [Moraxella sp.]